MDIPEDLSSLKRPALQALCKNYGVKANGKNVFMIAALERIRKDKMEVIESPVLPPTLPEDQPASSPAVCNSPSHSPITKDVKKAVRRSEKNKCKTRSKGNKESIAGSGNSTPANTEEPSTVLTSAPATATSPCELTSRKRKRRDTYSLSPHDSSLCSQSKVSRLSQDHTSPEHINTPDHTPVHPFSPPTKGITYSGTMKAKLSSTFVIDSSLPVTIGTKESSPCSLVSPIVTSGAIDTQEDSDQDNEATEVVNTRTRRSQTVDLPSATLSPSEKESVMVEVLQMLDMKVEERKCAPDYKPVYSRDIPHSRLPVKSKTQKKFDQAHAKHFSKMQSILSVAERKRKQMGNVPSCAAKRPRLSEKIEKPKGRAPLTTKSVSHNCPAKKSTTKMTSSKVFKPTVTSTKNMKVQFAKSTSKHAESMLRTPKKVVTMLHASAKKTPSKKPVYDLQASLKKKTPKSYRPYTGPVPKL